MTRRRVDRGAARRPPGQTRMQEGADGGEREWGGRRSVGEREERNRFAGDGSPHPANGERGDGCWLGIDGGGGDWRG